MSSKEPTVESTVFLNKLNGKTETTLENALNLTTYGKFNVFIVLIVGFSVVVNVAENVNVSLVTSHARCDLNFTLAEQGVLNSAGFAGILVSSHAFGFLADTWGRQKVLRTSLAGSFIFGLISAFAPTTAVLSIFRFVVGGFVAGITAAAFSYVSEFHSSKTCTRAVSITASFMPMAFIFMPIVARFLFTMQIEFILLGLKMSTWRLYMITSSFFTFIVFLIVCFLPESPKFLLSTGRKTEALSVLRRMFEINTGNPKEMFPVENVIFENHGVSLADTKGFLNVMKLIWNQTWPIFVHPHIWKTIKMSFLIFLLFSIGHGSFMWFPDFFSQLQSQSANQTVATLCSVVGREPGKQVAVKSMNCPFDGNMLTFDIILAIGFIFTFLSMLISFYIQKIGQHTYVYSSLILSAMCALSLVFVSNSMIIIFLMIAFLSCSLCASILSAISVSMFPTNIRAMATCAILMFGRVGAIVGSNLVGFLLKIDCNIIFYLFSFLLIASTGVYFSLMRQLKREKSLQQRNSSEI